MHAPGGLWWQKRECLGNSGTTRVSWQLRRGSKALNTELQGPSSLSRRQDRRIDPIDYFISMVGQYHFHNLKAAFAVLNPLCPSNVTNPLKIPHNSHSYSIPFSHLFLLSWCTHPFKSGQINKACSQNSANYVSGDCYQPRWGKKRHQITYAVS